MILIIKILLKKINTVIERTIEKNGESMKQSQYVKIDGLGENMEKEVSYNFHYNFWIYEGFTNREKLENLQKRSKNLLKKENFIDFLVSFIHSISSY